MGAWMTSQTGIGKTPAEAYRNAVAAAEAEYGHQEGYSGAINSGGHGFIVVDLPARMTFAKLQALLEDADESDLSYWRDEVRYAQQAVAAKTRGAKGRLAKAQRDLRAAEKRAAKIAAAITKAGFSSYDFGRIAETYHDKWAGYVAVELRGAEKTRYLGGRKLRRGERLYVFFGYAPS